MRKIIRIPISDVVPSKAAVLKNHGIPEGVAVDERMTSMAEESISIYKALAEPTGVIAEISKGDFEDVYQGEGMNAEETPLEDIYKSSDSLALYVVTVGENVCAEIGRLFDDDDFVIGSMLDSAASEGAEMAAREIELFYGDYLKRKGRFDSGTGILQFSPGYCGWHISSQKRLFEYLRPEEIDVRLRESFLVRPLKSISGVIVAGPKKIFEFEDAFPFCGDCQTHSCLDRIKAVFGQ